MTGPNHIVEESRRFVLRLLREKLAPWALYHDIRHTEETVDACREIGEASDLDDAQMEILLIAAWFHDTGYVDTVAGHEERGAQIAEEFLAGRSYPAGKIVSVRGCIMATRMPQSPATELERIICDADMIYLGRREFFEKNDLLKAEIEQREHRTIPETDWLKRSITFLSGQSYHTEYALKYLQDGISANIGILERQLRESGGEKKTG